MANGYLNFDQIVFRLFFTVEVYFQFSCFSLVSDVFIEHDSFSYRTLKGWSQCWTFHFFFLGISLFYLKILKVAYESWTYVFRITILVIIFIF